MKLLGLLGWVCLHALTGSGDAEQGLAAFRSGSYATASAALAAAVREDPGDLPSWRVLARSYQQLGDTARAAQIWSNLHTLQPWDPVAATGLGGALEATDPQGAVAAYRASLHYDPQQPTVWLRLGRLLETLEQFDAAQRVYADAAEQTPGAASPLRYAARLAARRGDTTHLQALLDRAATWAPNEVPRLRHTLHTLWLARGNSAYRSGAWHRAQAAYQQAVVLAPTDPNTQIRALAAHLAAHDHAAARATSAALHTCVGNDARWGVRAANVYWQYDASEAALTWLDAQTGPYRDSAVASLHARRGRQFLQNGAYAQAIAELRSATGDSAQAAHVWRNLGWAYARRGAWDAAAEAWENDARASPEAAGPRVLLAHAYLRSTRYRDALAASQQALRVAPADRQATLYAIQALAGLQKLPDAVALAAALANRCADDASVQQTYAHVLSDSGDAQALPQWARALALNPNSPAVRLHWLRAAYGGGQRNTAINCALQWAQQTPTPALLMFLARDREAQRDLPGALRWYQALLTDWPDPSGTRARHVVHVHMRLGQIDAALHTADVALARQPDQPNLLLARAEALQLAKQNAAARRVYATMLTRWPEHRAAFVGLVNTNLATGHFDEAQQLLARPPADAVTSYERNLWRADAFLATGALAAARAQVAPLIAPAANLREMAALLYHLSTTPVSVLAEHLQALQDAGYTTVTPSDVPAFQRGLRPWPSQPIMVVFDDPQPAALHAVDTVLAQRLLRASLWHAESATSRLPSARWEYHHSGALIQNATGFNRIGPAFDLATLRALVPPLHWQGDELIKHLREHAPGRLARLRVARAHLAAGDRNAAHATLTDMAAEHPSICQGCEAALAEVAWSDGRPRTAAYHVSRWQQVADANVTTTLPVGEHISWVNAPRVGSIAEARVDSDRRALFAEALQFTYPLISPVDVQLQAGMLQLVGPEVGLLQGQTLRAVLRWAPTRHLDVASWGQWTNLHSLAPWWSGGAEMRLRWNEHEVAAHGSNEALATAEAAWAGITVRNVGAAYNLSTPRWMAGLHADWRSLSDDNHLSMARALLYYRPQFFDGLEAGADLEHATSQDQATAYYTPRNYIGARLRLNYSAALAPGCTWGAASGLGIARDAVHATRWMGLLRVHGAYRWFDTLEASVTVQYVTTVSYQSAGAQAAVTWRL